MTTTLAPLAANARADASPRPEAPPVTSATAPFSSNMVHTLLTRCLQALTAPTPQLLGGIHASLPSKRGARPTPEPTDQNRDRPGVVAELVSAAREQP